MKLFILVLIIGCVSASFFDELDRASDDAVANFMVGMEYAPSLQETAGFGYSIQEELGQLEDDIKTELGKTFQETLNDISRKIKDSVERGREISRELAAKAKEIGEKLKALGQEGGSKAQELLGKIKERVQHWLRDLLSRVGIGKKDILSQLIQTLDTNSLLQKIRAKLADQLNIDKIKEYIRRVFGELSAVGRALLKAIQNQGQEGIKELAVVVLPKENQLREYELVEVERQPARIQKRWLAIAQAACYIMKYVGLGWGTGKLQAWINSNVEPFWRGKLTAALKVGTPALKFLLGRFCPLAPVGPSVNYDLIELWNRIREVFKGLGIEIQEKFFRFADWVRTTVKGGLDNITEKVEKIKEIARQIIENSKTMSKEVAREALEFLQPYKEDLGQLFDQAMEAINRVLGRNPRL